MQHRYIRQVLAPGIAIALLPLAICIGALHRGGALWDDAFMFARYGQHFLSGGGISWNPDGQPTYGLTSHAYFFWLLPFLAVWPKFPALALWWASAGSGLMFLALLFRLIERISEISENSTVSERWLLGFFTAILVGAAAPELAVHFASGMDTMLALAWVTSCLGIFYCSPQPPKGLLLGSCWVALGFCVRPDALLLLIPAWLLLQADFKAALKRALECCCMIALQILLGRWYFGSWLPYPFFVKSGHLYGPEFYDFFAGASLHYLLLFLSALPWAILALGAQVALCPPSFSRRQQVLLFSSLLFCLYQLWFVTPIMGEHSRFFFPLFPVICAITAESVLALKRWAQKLPSALDALEKIKFPWVLLFCVAAAVTLKSEFLVDALKSNASTSRRDWSLVDIFHAHYERSWAQLDRVAPLPPSLSIAATEVGLLGLMDTRKTVIDMTGLHDRRFLKGFSPTLLWTEAPDLVYMPFPHYKQMIAAIETDQTFQSEFVYFTAEQLDTRFGVAIRKQSPHFRALNSIFNR